MKGFKTLALLGVFMFSISLAAACLNLNSQTTKQYLTEISSINAQLGPSCSPVVPDALFRLVGAGNILVTINMNSGSMQQFYITIDQNEVLTGITNGFPASYTFEVTTSEAVLDTILTSNDVLGATLAGVNNKDITVRANTFFGKIKWFFAKFFLPSSSSSTVVVAGGGQPDNCHETYLPGWQEYSDANIQQQWDSYSAQTDGVCQFDVGTPGPQGNDCVYVYQKVKGGATSWLCWYNE